MLFLVLSLALPVVVQAETPVKPEYTRQEIEGKWRARIQSFLDKGEIPLIDLQYTSQMEQKINNLGGCDQIPENHRFDQYCN